MEHPVVVVLMGVAGSGKSVVGEALAARQRWRFVEGDDFHPSANIDKMSRGIALTDSDREPWLDALGRAMAIISGAGESIVVACSALRAEYRTRLLRAVPQIRFAHLVADRTVLAHRLRVRKGHFADDRLLDSQLATLEPPSSEESIQIESDRPVSEIVEEIAALLRLGSR